MSLDGALHLFGELVMRSFLVIAILLCSGLVYGEHLLDGQSKTPTAYQQLRDGFKTKLIRMGPSPQKGKKEALPTNVKEILYPSGSLMLRAWVYVPPRQGDRKAPALVYCHGGFAFGADDFRHCQPFVDAGFVVMCPMFRGENGNPGNFELFLGEVDDAKNAALWLAGQPYVDKERIFAFGHSSGGGIAALLSLLEDVPIRHSGSSGGLYGPDTFDGWHQFVPFDLKNPDERRVRVLLGNIKDMRRRHFAYVGKDDNLRANAARAKQEISRGKAQLEVIEMPGNHFTSLRPALVGYLEVIQKNK